MRELKRLSIWVCWNAKEIKGRMTKVPCAAKGGATGTNNEYAHTWVTYDEAVKALKRHGHTGVGFIIPKGVFFVDKDHIDPDDSVVRMLLKKFSSYAERSFSGNGVHIYGFCDPSRIPIQNDKLDLRYYTKNPHNGMEVYIGGLTSRFAVYTGDALQDMPLTDCTVALLDLLEEEMLREKEVQPESVGMIDAMNGARCYVYRDGAYRLMSRTMMLGVIKQFIVDYNEHLVKTRVLNEVYDLLLTDNLFVSEEDLNGDEDIINFRNGLLRLSDMTLIPHTPDILSTIQLPCMNSISIEKQDKYLLDKLLSERTGIVYCMVMALKNVIDNGYRFTEPESVKTDRKLYRNSNSTVVTFFEDCMMPITEAEKHRHCTAMKVYSAYQDWCRDNNRGYAKTAREFKDELAAHLGITAKELTVRRKEGMIYREYTLTPEAAAAYIRHSPYCTIPEEDFFGLKG